MYFEVPLCTCGGSSPPHVNIWIALLLLIANSGPESTKKSACKDASDFTMDFLRCYARQWKLKRTTVRVAVSYIVPFLYWWMGGFCKSFKSSRKDFLKKRRKYVRASRKQLHLLGGGIGHGALDVYKQAPILYCTELYICFVVWCSQRRDRGKYSYPRSVRCEQVHRLPPFDPKKQHWG